MMKKLYDISKKYPILVGIVGFLVIYFSFLHTPSTPSQNSYELSILKFILAIACTGFVALISGNKIIENSGNRTGYGLLIGIPIILINGLLGILGLIIYLFGDKTLVDGWLPNLLLLALACLSIGFFEETLFRALINDAILYQFRNKKGVFVAIAITSSLAFGIVHVLGSDVHSLFTFLQALLKTISCAMAGFLILSVYWKTHNIIVCVIIHALSDFIPSISFALFSNGEELDSYVMEGSEGMGQIAGQAAQIILSVIAFFILLKVIKSIDFKKIREEW